MRSRELKRIVLNMFGDGDFYGYDVHRKISAFNIKIEISRLYRVLNEMLKEGLLESRWEKSHLGPKKRVYRIGEKGREELENILLEAIGIVHMFYGKYILNLPTSINPISKICSIIVDDLEGGTLGYLVGEYSGMHEIMIRKLHDRLSETVKYLIKPTSTQIELKIEKLILMDGSYDNIPLKTDYLDLLIVTDLPPANLLEESFREWHRVIKQDGRLAILEPSILLNENKDPLTIGDFVEKNEHEKIEKGENISKKYLQELLGTRFQKFEEKEIVHMTILLASKQK